MKGHLHKNALAFASMTFGFTMMNSVFSFYYVKIFLNHYRVSQFGFDVAQVIYLLWNSINDPLFAYWQDNSKWEMFRSRRLNILYAAPFFSLSFLLAWFPWGDYTDHPWLAGIHLLVALSCYDTCFTFIGLAQCALYAEISQKHEDRLRLTKYTQIASILGSSSVFFSQVLCDGLSNMRAFQTYVVILSVISWCSMYYTGKYVRTKHDHVPVPIDILSPSISTERPQSDRLAPEDGVSTSPFGQFKQIVREKNFILFVTVNFMQLLQISYISNFLSIFCDELIPEEVLPPLFRKILYGSAFIIPQILVLCLSHTVGSRGYYQVILWSFYLKVFCAMVVFVMGREQFVVLAVFLIIESSLPSAIFAFFNLPVSDIIDKDQKMHKRKLPLSSSVFAYNALFTKPAQSVAPMLIVAVLDRNHYQDKLAGDITTVDHEGLKSAMFLVTCTVPFVIGLLQIIVWRPYSIRDSHITIPKHVDT